MPREHLRGRCPTRAALPRISAYPAIPLPVFSHSPACFALPFSGAPRVASPSPCLLRHVIRNAHVLAPRAAWPLVAVFTAGYLASYLLPTIVGRLSAHLGLSPAQAGLVGSALLLSSASAGFTLAGRVERYGSRTPARAGLVLAVVGYGSAALAGSVPLVVLSVVVGGFGSGAATAVAAAGIAAQRDPHRTSSLGLLTVSATAGALYLTIPHLGGGHRLPFAAIALVALLVWPATARLNGPTATGERPRRSPAGCRTAAPVSSWRAACSSGPWRRTRCGASAAASVSSRRD